MIDSNRQSLKSILNCLFLGWQVVRFHMETILDSDTDPFVDNGLGFGSGFNSEFILVVLNPILIGKSVYGFEIRPI